jgi:hypothetical protein
MPAKRFLRNVGGRVKEVIGVIVSAGAANDGDIPALDATGKLDASVMPAGIGQNTTTAITSEALAVNDLVNVYDNTGTPTARKADATVEGKEATGFVKAAFGSGATATIYMSGNIITGLTGLTAGRRYLATTAGASTATAPSASGNVSQKIGDALTATTILFEPEEPITIA